MQEPITLPCAPPSAVGVGVTVGVGVIVAVLVWVGVFVAVEVWVGVLVAVGVIVGEGVCVDVGTGVPLGGICVGVLLDINVHADVYKKKNSTNKCLFIIIQTRNRFASTINGRTSGTESNTTAAEVRLAA